ncbi:MAG: 3-keto-5-aminohexanoate cleavage protein, partial [Cereibacter changlensis]
CSGSAEAGTAILHLHARNPEDGGPTADPAVFGHRLTDRSTGDVLSAKRWGESPTACDASCGRWRGMCLQRPVASV